MSERRPLGYGDDEPLAAVLHQVTRRTLRASQLSLQVMSGAAAALLVSFLVVNYSQAALSARTDGSGAQLRSGTVELTDDDGGRELFAIDNMAPDRPVSRCLAVVYTGSVDAVDVGLTMEGRGRLVDALRYTVELGRGGGYDGCEGFEPERTLRTGNFGAFLRAPAELYAWTAGVADRRRTFRFTFTMTDDAPAGADASATFVWRTDA